MENFSIDAYKPAEIATRVDRACVSKSQTDAVRLFVLAVLAGAFIAFGAAFYTVVMQDAASANAGVMRLLGGLAFCLGLILVVVAGAELFTGNNLLVLAWMDGRISIAKLLRNWVIVYLGNFVGALGLVLLMWASGLWSAGDGVVGAKAVSIAQGKVNQSFIEAVARGVLCNALVCLAVWLCFAGHSVADKILAILFPISAFVALGFEHSVANMYFIPAGMLAQSDISVVTEAGVVEATTLLSVSDFLVANLLPVTLGNILGGGVFVALVYWFIYLRK